jgi:hypothetical protein
MLEKFDISLRNSLHGLSPRRDLRTNCGDSGASPWILLFRHAPSFSYIDGFECGIALWRKYMNIHRGLHVLV